MKQLENKWLLLDTNVLIEQSLHPQHPFWLDFERKRIQLNCQAIAVPEVQFELFRRVRSKKDEETLSSFLDEVRVLRIALPNPEAWQRATEIGQLYALAKLEGIGPIDCILASYLQYYAQNLYLATFNNRDFPVTLFDRHNILNFEIKNEIKALGIYSFSEEKFEHLTRRFLKAKSPKN